MSVTERAKLPIGGMGDISAAMARADVSLRNRHRAGGVASAVAHPPTATVPIPTWLLPSGSVSRLPPTW